MCNIKFNMNICFRFIKNNTIKKTIVLYITLSKFKLTVNKVNFVLFDINKKSIVSIVENL